MSDSPDLPGEDPFEHLPEELRKLLAQFGGQAALSQFQRLLASTPSGPVNWDLAGQVARQLAADGDRAPTDAEVAVAREAQELAEHWLDQGSLPSPPDAGRLAIASRQEWVHAALAGLRPLVEPIAAAATRTLGELAGEQLAEFGDLGLGLGLDVGAMQRMLAPLGAVLTGLQAGQVVGQLSRQLLGQFELGVPTAESNSAYHLAVNVAAVFEGYGLDPTEVAVVLALHEGALRRQYQAVPWLAGHLHALVAQFAAETSLDAERLRAVTEDLLTGVDPDDPESLEAALARASELRMDPTPAQRRILERLQGVVCLVQGWARHEVAAAAAGRLPNVDRVEEVLRRRRAAQGDGEKLLAQLLGLDLKPEDETVGDRFVAAIADGPGLGALRRALAHPENLPDSEELAEPVRWLARLADVEGVPDDVSTLFGAGEAPVERTAVERLAELDTDGPDHDGPAGSPPETKG